MLVVEDDEATRSELVAALEGSGFDVRAERDGTSVAAAVSSFRPDLMILDVGLPNSIDGFEVARRIRSKDSVALVFLTSAGSETERLRGFDLGADDYVVKPVSIPELVARVRAVLRRSNRLGRSVWRVGELEVDEEAHTVVMCGQPVELTALEFSVLAALCRRPGQVISKVQLLTEVWGFDHYALNVVEVHISALRKKLEAHGPPMVHTVRGVGYVMRG